MAVLFVDMLMLFATMKYFIRSQNHLKPLSQMTLKMISSYLTFQLQLLPVLFRRLHLWSLLLYVDLIAAVHLPIDWVGRCCQVVVLRGGSVVD